MKRYRFFEFEDYHWFPDVLRTGMLDYLRFLIRLLRVYNSITPVLLEVLEKTGETQIVDLGSGGGGPVLQVRQNLNLQNKQVAFILTDKFPNLDAWRYLRENTNQQIDFYPTSVDAENVPETLHGIRTLFSTAHHFRPAQIKAILQASVNQKQAICLFDGGDKNWFFLLGSLIVHPVVFFFCTPFLRPFKISRLVFTYLIPLIPLSTIWDGCVSLLRLYQPQEFLQLAQSIPTKTYTWKAGKTKNNLGVHVAYLIGYPNLDTEI
ncbi:MAG: hypothetical protein V5804_14335 [Mucilaginibacter sp.]|uniref:hypothetical protein n=1 Tax=Mucilaginibacter sp. TaxID=1882438 RepID=UPI0034E51476